MRIEARNLLLAYAGLVALWQIVGVGLIASGGRSPGPSASILGAILAVAMGSGIVFTFGRWPRICLALAGFSGLLAGQALYNAWMGDASLWPSAWTRGLGAAINAIGLAGALLALQSFLVQKS